MYREKFHYVGLYKMNFMVIDSDDPDKIERKYEIDIESDTWYASTHLYKIGNGKGAQKCVFIVLNSNAPYKSRLPASMAHECVHAAHFILRNSGVRSDFYNDEPVTYLVEYLYNIVYKFMKNKL